jgi:nitrite reductase/ring-hydroxylating ferredoxin subunit
MSRRIGSDRRRSSCPTRRAFLGDLAALPIALAAALGIDAREAAAWTVGRVEPVQANPRDRLYRIPEADGVLVDRALDIGIVRSQGVVYALNLACPHQGASVTWRRDQKRFICPSHGAAFRADGGLAGGPTNRNLDRFAVRRDGTRIAVDVDRLLRSDQDKAEWAKALVRL